MSETQRTKIADPFQINEILETQEGLVRFLEQNPTDVGVKIAALRATADLLTAAVSQAAIAASIHSLLSGKR